MLFEAGVLKSRSYAVPVISVGNITVGGTGKTPHVEYLAALLKDRLKVAVLSRGYKRKSHGFLLATSDTPMRLLGDEPWQIKHRFPDIAVAVDKKRTHGIETLLSTDETSGTDVILLDDAFQHRYVKPGINILLVDHHRLIIHDMLLPAGRLREPLKSKDRADIVIVTKCPKTLTPMDFRVLTKQMNLYPYQKLFFTTFSYATPRPVFSEGSPLTEDAEAPLDCLAGRHVLLLTGIASPKQMLLDIQNEATPASITPMAFADHHRFSRKDIRRINEAFEALPQPRLVITTEKDAARLYEVEGLSPAVRQATYALPVKVSFMLDGEETFNETIRNYVLKNSRNSILATGKSETKVRRADKSEEKPLTISFK
jgi:tetraacyldisaccharide 4'-kinase